MEKNTGLVGRLMVVVKDLAGIESLKHGEEHRAGQPLDGRCGGPGRNRVT